MTLVKFNNNRNQSLLPGFNDVFDSIFNDTFFNDRMVARVPAANISESENNFHVELAAPGLKKEDFKVNLEKGLLTIGYEKKNENESNEYKTHRREFNFTSFKRSFRVDDVINTEAIQAKYEDGVLKLYLPKKEEVKALPKEISIQ